MCEVATGGVEDQGKLLHKGKNTRKPNGTTRGIVVTRAGNVRTMTCLRTISIVGQRLPMIVTTAVVLEDEPFFSMWHLDLPLDTIHNNDETHY